MTDARVPRSLQEVLQSISDVMFPSDPERCPAIVAVTQNNLAMARAMLEAGAQPDIRCEFGDTAAERALLQGGPMAGLFK